MDELRTNVEEDSSSGIDVPKTPGLPDDGTTGRRTFLGRAGKLALGAATVAFVAIKGEKEAHAIPGPYGCCWLAYSRFCTSWEWAHCGYCNSTTDEYGNPTGKWWWSCRQNSNNNRFCGECSDHDCSYTYTYTKDYGLLSCQ